MFTKIKINPFAQERRNLLEKLELMIFNNLMIRELTDKSSLPSDLTKQTGLVNVYLY